MGRHGSANMPPRKNFLSCSPEVYSGVTSSSGNADHNVGQCSSADRALVSPHVMSGGNAARPPAARYRHHWSQWHLWHRSLSPTDSPADTAAVPHPERPGPRLCGAPRGCGGHGYQLGGERVRSEAHRCLARTSVNRER